MSGPLLLLIAVIAIYFILSGLIDRPTRRTKTTTHTFPEIRTRTGIVNPRISFRSREGEIEFVAEAERILRETLIRLDPAEEDLYPLIDEALKKNSQRMLPRPSRRK